MVFHRFLEVSRKQSKTIVFNMLFCKFNAKTYKKTNVFSSFPRSVEKTMKKHWFLYVFFCKFDAKTNKNLRKYKKM